MEIKKTNRNDAKSITELTLRSKNYWNYGAEQMEEWRDEMTIDSKYIDENQVYKLVDNEKLIGFYAYQPENTKDIKLNFFFVEPDCIGKGYGKLLMNDFLIRIKNTDCERVILDADPNAEKFYERLGFKVIGKLQSSIKNRILPIMELKIQKDNN